VKVGSSPDYVVRVTQPGWYKKPEQAPLYEGLYHFDLNHVVDISFVPRVTAAGPPWSPDGLPDDVADFTTAEQVRLWDVLSGGYSVTPDDERAGTVEQLPYMFEWPPPDDDFWSAETPPPTPIVFFVSTREFDRLSADLEALTDIAGGIQSMVRHSEVADHEAVRFIDQRIISALNPFDVVSAGQAR